MALSETLLAKLKDPTLATGVDQRSMAGER